MQHREARRIALFALAAALAPSAAGGAGAAIGPCRFEVGAGRAGVVAALAETCAGRAPRIFRELGAGRPGGPAPVTVRIVDSPSGIGGASPAGARPPPWSIAVAYPSERLVVLSLRHRDGRPVEDLALELEHELSHVAMRDALRGAPAPRWLSEGVAVMQSERSTLLRRGELTLASLGGRVRPLAALHDYPEGDVAVALAYAEAADFVGFLLGERGWSGIRALLRRLARGDAVDEALETAYGRTAAQLEKDWRRALAERPGWVAVLTGSGALWGLATALFLLAAVVARRRKRRRMEEMARAEEWAPWEA